MCTPTEEGEVFQLFNLHKDPGETIDLFEAEGEIALRLRKDLYASIGRMQAERLAMMAKEKVKFSQDDIPKDARLERPIILSPKDKSVIRLKKEKGKMVVSWTGDGSLTYVIQYDVGKGWRNLKGTIPVQGNRKVFGPLPKEAWQPLPYWNPYRIRISPYGVEKYWSDWIEFSIEGPEKP